VVRLVYDDNVRRGELPVYQSRYAGDMNAGGHLRIEPRLNDPMKHSEIIELLGALCNQFGAVCQKQHTSFFRFGPVNNSGSNDCFAGSCGGANYHLLAAGNYGVDYLPYCRLLIWPEIYFHS
jgi:hypothetical protein